MSSERWRSEEDVIRSLDFLSEMTEDDINLKPLRIESEREVGRRERKIRRQQLKDMESNWNHELKGVGRGQVIRTQEEKQLSRKEINEMQLQRQLRESLGLGFSNEVIEKHFGHCNEGDDFADVKQDWCADYSCFSNVEESEDSGSSESTSCVESRGHVSTGGEQHAEIVGAAVSPSPSPVKQYKESCGIYVPPPMRIKAQQKNCETDSKKNILSDGKIANGMVHRVVAVHDTPKLADFLAENNTIFGSATKVWTPCDLPGNVNRLAKQRSCRAVGNHEAPVDVSSCSENCRQLDLRSPPQMLLETTESIAEFPEPCVSPYPRISSPLHVISLPSSEFSSSLARISSPSPEYPSLPPKSSSSPNQHSHVAETTTITPFAGRDFYSLNAKLVEMNKYGYSQIPNESVCNFNRFSMSNNNRQNSFHITPEEFPAL